MVSSNIPNNLLKENWKNDHLNFKHDGTLYTWCPLCMTKQDGEKNKIKNNDLGINVDDNVKAQSVFGV